MRYKDFNMNDHGFAGHLVLPDRGSEKAVIVIMGGEKSILPGKKIAERFADFGFAGLSVSLFGADGLPGSPDRIPLEMFGAAIQALKDMGMNSISIYGMSMGTIFAALTAEYFGGIVIFHGVGGNGRMLEFIAVPLWRAGYEVVCPDLPLYGLTEYKGKVTYSDWIDCGTKVCRYYGKQGLPLFVFGLSAGGMLAYQVACRLEKVDGLMATCLLDQRDPAVTINTASNRFTAAVGKPFLRVAHGLLGSVKIPMKAVGNMQAIVNDERVARLLMSDPLSSGAKVTLEFIHGILNPDISPEAKDFRKCPALLAHPEKDNWTDVSLSRLFFDDLTVSKKLVMLPGAGHFPIEPQGLSVLANECLRFMDEIVRNGGM